MKSIILVIAAFASLAATTPIDEDATKLQARATIVQLAKVGASDQFNFSILIMI